MNDVIEVWSRSGDNLEAIAYIILEIQSLETRRVGQFRFTHILENGRLLQLLMCVLCSLHTSAILAVLT